MVGLVFDALRSPRWPLSLVLREQSYTDSVGQPAHLSASKPKARGLASAAKIVSGNRLWAGTEGRRPSGINPGRLLHFRQRQL